MQHRARTAGLALGLAALLVLSACGSSDSSGSAGTTAAAATEATTTTTAPDAVAGPRATGEAVPSAGCTSEAAIAEPVKNEKHEVAGQTDPSDGTTRWYLLTTPAKAGPGNPLPLVVDYHGLSEGAEVHTKMSAMPEKAQSAGFITVLPQGTGPTPHWDAGLNRTENQDLVFVDAMLDQVEKDLCVDTSRVYAAGLSNGAFMSSTMACAVSDRFAAVAPVAGITRTAECTPDRPMPILAFHGTGDPILLFNGGVGPRLTNSLNGGTDPEPPLPEADLNGEGYPAAAQAWAEGNGCKPKATDRDRTDTVIERTWDCPAEAPVVFEIIEGGGHSWPGSEFSKSIENIVGPTDTSIDATDLAWTFFQRFQLPAS